MAELQYEGGPCAHLEALSPKKLTNFCEEKGVGCQLEMADNGFEPPLEHIFAQHERRRRSDSQCAPFAPRICLAPTPLSPHVTAAYIV